MDDSPSNPYTRYPTGASRRASLLALGVAGLSALSSPLGGEARKRSRKKNRKRCKANGRADRCPEQVQPCIDFVVTTLCAGAPGCAERATCCNFLEKCNAEAFLTCMNTSV